VFAVLAVVMRYLNKTYKDSELYNSPLEALADLDDFAEEQAEAEEASLKSKSKSKSEPKSKS